jgi:putative transposase
VKLDPLKHHRRSIRLPHYDYTRAGAYFVTVVAQDRQCVFAEIVANEAVLTAAGVMVWEVLQALPTHYRGVGVDACVVMPNHVHSIVMLADVEHDVSATSPKRLSLPDVVHRFKTMTTTRYIAGVNQHGWPGFRKRLWQRNYYEEVIRSEARWNQVRQYIADNPRRWAEDKENPNVPSG